MFSHPLKVKKKTFYIVSSIMALTMSLVLFFRAFTALDLDTLA